MKALVTGAGGFTGSHLVRYLAAEGDDVRAMVRDAAKAPRFDDAPGRVEVVTGDLTDSRSLEKAMQGVDVVYNIAARYREANLTAATYRAVNATAVASIVSMAPSAGVRRVVQCSTVGVHGDIAHPPASEDAPLQPGDVYQETKLEGEELGREAAARHGVDFVIARPTGIYGPGDRRLFKLIGGVARGRFLMLGPGRNFYHLTYVEDLSAGFRLCGTVPAAAGRTYILAGGEVTTLAELITIIADVAGVSGPKLRLPVTPFWLAGAVCEGLAAPFGIEPPIYRRRVDFFRKSRAFDASRAKAELGYAPAVGLRDGIGRTLQWYREQGWV